MNQLRLNRQSPVPRRDSVRGVGAVPVWLFVFLAFALLTSTTAMADVEADAVREYSSDFGVSTPRAEENLEIQDQAAELGIVERLEQRLNGKYAGVWFDNDAGEFVVPLLPTVSRSAVTAELAPAGLEDDLRTVQVQSSWEELEAAQERIDKALLPLIEESLVQTSLDPRTNAVVISEAEGTSKAERAQIESRAAAESVHVEVRQESAEHFSVGTMACKTSTPRACGRPLRGGVSLTPTCNNCTYALGECSAGFKATGKVYGNRYILTAGHCAEKFSKWGSEDAGGTWHLIGSVEEYTFPSNDWAKVKANGSEYWDWTPWPTQVAHFWEDQERAITAERVSYLGEYVCHSGNKTGTSCGHVSELNHTVTDDSTGKVIYHEVEFGNVCSIGGDSGGAVFIGNMALGLYSASTEESYPGACDTTAYYVQITEATDALGVSVAPRIEDPNPYSWHSENLGGVATSDPDALTAGPGHLEVFERGSDAALWTRSYSGYQWNNWSSVTWPVQGGPGAVWGSGMANVTTRLNDNSIHSLWWNGSWSGYNLGGGNTSDPDMSAWGTTRMDMFSRGGDNALWHRAWNSGIWGGWEKIGGTLSSGPAAVSWGANRIDVVARANDNTLQTWYYDGSWHTGANLGGVNTSDPDITATAPGHLVVAVRGSDYALWIRQYDVSSGWAGWEKIGGMLSSGPSAVSWGVNYRLDLFAQATDHTLTHWWWGPGA